MRAFPFRSDQEETSVENISVEWQPGAGLAWEEAATAHNALQHTWGEEGSESICQNPSFSSKERKKKGKLRTFDAKMFPSYVFSYFLKVSDWNRQILSDY